MAAFQPSSPLLYEQNGDSIGNAPSLHASLTDTSSVGVLAKPDRT